MFGCTRRFEDLFDPYTNCRQLGGFEGKWGFQKRIYFEFEIEIGTGDDGGDIRGIEGMMMKPGSGCNLPVD